MRIAFPDARVDEVEAGWEDRWREFHHPVRIGPLWVGPPWETPPPGAVAVIVDPGRAFGTGAHPTTRLCLELLLEQQAGSFLDVGCGSGALSIAAALLGHAPVTAVDIAPPSVEATRANAAVNSVVLTAQLGDATTQQLPPVQLVAANISLPAVLALVPRLDTDRLIASGYLASDRPELDRFRRVGRRELDGWAADLFERR